MTTEEIQALLAAPITVEELIVARNAARVWRVGDRGDMYFDTLGHP